MATNPYATVTRRRSDPMLRRCIDHGIPLTVLSLLTGRHVYRRQLPRLNELELAKIRLLLMAARALAKLDQRLPRQVLAYPPRVPVDFVGRLVRARSIPELDPIHADIQLYISELKATSHLPMVNKN